MIGTFLIFRKNQSNNILVSSLGFAAGVMITISITDLLPSSLEMLTNKYFLVPAVLISAILFSLGVLFSMLVDKYLPEGTSDTKNPKLYRVGLISCLAIILHNIPEGIITYITSSQDIKLGISLAIAIALHNIPEGISISVPIYYSTGSRAKALFYTFISGLSEPLGAIIAYFVLAPFVSDTMMGLLYAFIGGIMVHISFYELLPESLSYKNKSKTIISFILGSIFMLISHMFFS